MIALKVLTGMTLFAVMVSFGVIALLTYESGLEHSYRHPAAVSLACAGLLAWLFFI